MDEPLVQRTQHLAHRAPNRPERPIEALAGPEPWEAPIPLGYQGKPPVFPAHRFPPWLNAYVCALAEAMQVPVDLPSMLAISGLGTAAGGRAVVEVKPGWREPLNIFTVTAMSPGARKTPVFLRMIAPLMVYERDAVANAKPELNETRARKAVAGAEAIKAQQEAERSSEAAREEAIKFAAAKAAMAEAITLPTLPRLLADDATPEALTSLLAEQGGRLGLFSDEGEVFSMMAGRYSSSGPNLAVYLKGHVGSPIRVDRKGRDAEYIEAPALTLGLTVQPAVLESVMGIEGARGRGLLGRFLWSVPQSNIGTRKSDPTNVDEATEARFNTEMQVLVASLAEWTDPVPLVFTHTAKMTLIDYQKALEPRLGPEGDLGHIADWAAKLVGHIARLAGLLHLATNVRTGWSDPVETSVVEDAIHIGGYLIDHALIAFDSMQGDNARHDAKALLSWIYMRDITEFSQREAHRSHQHRFAEPLELKDALGLLEGNGFIRRIPEPQGATRRGRPRSPRYEVNPFRAGPAL